MSIFKSKKTSHWHSRPIGRLSLGRESRLKRKSVKKIFLFLIFLFLIGLIGLVSGFIWLRTSLPSPDKLLERAVAQSTKIYDRTGKTVLYEIFAGQRRTLVKLEEIPQELIWATIVNEDKNFYQHQGFNLRSMVRALLIDLIRGGKFQGGSTITQQFIKNAFLSPKKSLIRKVRELILAYQIEKRFSKNQILQMYFNEIPYGSNAYGAEAASQIYFGKSVRDLTLDEAALLAALPKAPTYYSPSGEHRDELVERQKYILDLLAELNYIPKERVESAKKVDILNKIITRKENILAPHFVMYIKGLLTEKYGQRLVEQGGLKVITTLDLDKQRAAEQAIQNWAEKNQKNWGASNAALIAFDVKTNEIVAMVGSKDYFDEKIDGQVNVVLRPRQPGSSFKPIVYSVAFEKGYTPETILFDVLTNFGPSGSENKDYIPKDYDEKERGPVTMRQALAGSLNIPGVQTLYLAGLNNVLNLAQRMGYTTLTDPSRYGLSLVLGGGEVKLLEHTSAFGIFAREGKKMPITAILKVEDSQGRILEETNPETLTAQEVLSSQISRQISNILSDNQARSFIFGPQSKLFLPDRPVAAKTGTTNDWLDGWTIGYTPSLVAGVWVGNNRNQEMKKGADGVQVAAPIWNDFMKLALANTPPENFNPPDPVQVDKPILRGELPDEITVKIDKASGKLATELTPPSFVIEKTFKGYHSILYYVDKDNPQGSMPTNPEQDPQYQRWEDAIKKWLKNQKSGLEIPPTEYDDLHIPANQPSLSIISPQTGFSTGNQTFRIRFEAQTKRTPGRVECLIDNVLNNIIYNFSDECFLNLTGLSQGWHQIKLIAYDDIDNSRAEEISFNLEQKWPEKIIWLSPQNNQVVWQESFPLPISLIGPIMKVQSARFYLRNLTDNQTKLLSTIFSPASNKLTFTWAGADNDSYELWVEIINSDQRILTSDKISVEVK